MQNTFIISISAFFLVETYIEAYFVLNIFRYSIFSPLDNLITRATFFEAGP